MASKTIQFPERGNKSIVAVIVLLWVAFMLTTSFWIATSTTDVDVEKLSSEPTDGPDSVHHMSNTSEEEQQILADLEEDETMNVEDPEGNTFLSDSETAAIADDESITYVEVTEETDGTAMVVFVLGVLTVLAGVFHTFMYGSKSLLGLWLALSVLLMGGGILFGW